MSRRGRLHRDGVVEAASTGNLDRIRECVEQGEDVDSRNRLGQTALHLAASAGNTACIKWLLDRGAKVDAATNSCTTPLHFAARNGNLECVDILLANGAKTFRKNVMGKLPLHIAIEKGHVKVAERLLAASNDVNEVDLRGRSALFMAVERRDHGMAEMLLRKGASLVQVGEADWDDELTPTELAWRTGNQNLAKMLESRRKGGKDRENDERAERERQARKADVRSLFLAAWAGDVKTMEGLLARGTPSDGKDSHGNTPLHEAVEHGHCRAAEVLINHGANVLHKDVKGNSALHLACVDPQLACIDLVVQRGANTNDQNVHGETPLHVVVQRKLRLPGSSQSRTQLVVAVPETPGRYSSLHSANRWPSVGSLEQLDSLQSRRSSFGSSNSLDRLLSGSGSNGYLSILGGGDPSAAATNPGEVAAGWDMEDPVVKATEILLAYGADPYVKDNRGQTAVTIAIERGHGAALNWMLGFGDDFEMQRRNVAIAIQHAYVVKNDDLAHMLEGWLMQRVQSSSSPPLSPKREIATPPTFRSYEDFQRPGSSGSIGNGIAKGVDEVEEHPFLPLVDEDLDRLHPQFTEQQQLQEAKGAWPKVGIERVPSVAQLRTGPGFFIHADESDTAPIASPPPGSAMWASTGSFSTSSQTSSPQVPSPSVSFRRRGSRTEVDLPPGMPPILTPLPAHPVSPLPPVPSPRPPVPSPSSKKSVFQSAFKSADGRPPIRHASADSVMTPRDVPTPTRKPTTDTSASIPAPSPSAEDSGAKPVLRRWPPSRADSAPPEGAVGRRFSENDNHKRDGDHLQVDAQALVRRWSEREVPAQPTQNGNGLHQPLSPIQSHSLSAAKSPSVSASAPEPPASPLQLSNVSTGKSPSVTRLRSPSAGPASPPPAGLLSPPMGPLLSHPISPAGSAREPLSPALETFVTTHRLDGRDGSATSMSGDDSSQQRSYTPTKHRFRRAGGAPADVNVVSAGLVASVRAKFAAASVSESKPASQSSLRGASKRFSSTEDQGA